MVNNTDEISPETVRTSLQLALDSGKFSSARKLSDFLSYVVEEKLAGREAELKAYTIAVEAIGRSEDFDPQTDPAVRVLAGRLRTTLDQFYAEEGAESPVIISIPTGTYRPEFTLNETTVPELPAPVETKSNQNKFIAIAAAVLALIGIGYFLFAAQQGEDNAAQVADMVSDKIVVVMGAKASGPAGSLQNADSDRFARQLRSALARNDTLSIIVRAQRSDTDTSDQKFPQANFIIDSNVQTGGISSVASIELINARNNALVWGRSYKFTTDADDPAPSNLVIARVVRELTVQIFGASMRELEERDPNELTASQLFVLATWVPGPAKSTLEWEKERVALARLALKKNPNFGPAHSVLADKLAYLAAVDAPSDTVDLRAEARASAMRALNLDAANENVLFNIAQYYWHSGQLDNAILTYERLLEVDPNHGLARFFLTVIPHTCTPAPDDVLAQAIAFDKSLAPDNPVRWVTLTWTGWLHLNRDEYQLALAAEQRASQIFQIPYTAMRRAAILNVLGRSDAANELINMQRKSWPNIDPAHFSKVTMPRLCQQRSGAEKMIGFYERLTESLGKYQSKN